MIWSHLAPWLSGRGKKAPARRVAAKAQLTVEILEDRLVPSTLYQAWREQKFHVDDVKVANMPSAAVAQATVPTNASFGSMIGLPSAFTNTPYRGDGYSVAVIDTGIDYNNPSLGGGFGAGHRVIAGWDFVNNDGDPMDDNGHGTHVAGIIGSSDATYSGIAPNVNLIALKVLDSSGSGTFGNVQSALDWVVANQAKYHIVALNMSLGSGNYTTNPYTFLDSEFTTLRNDGVFMSVAAGNSFYSVSSATGLDFPAVDPLVVAVGAVYDGNYGSVAWASGARDYTTAVDRIASFSQRGSALSIMAPGAMVTSTYLNNTFQAMAGTSMASPVVAGAAVLIHQAMDSLHLAANQDTILSVMKKTGVNVVDGDDENDNVVNTGLTFKRLDLGAALASLGTPVNSAPVLQPISAQKLSPGSSVQITLNATDPNGDAITFSASVLGSSASLGYQLKQQLGLKYAGSYYMNAWGQNEKWMTSTNGNWYCILPNGELRVWAGSVSATLQPAHLVATLSVTYFADPSLLWSAASASTGSSASQGYQLKQQLGLQFASSYYTNIWGQNEKWMTSTSGNWYCLLPNGELRLWAGSMATTLQPAYLIATLATSYYADPSLLWNAQSGAGSVPLGSSASTGYQLKQQLGLQYAGSYYTNLWGQNEKWMTSTSGNWYCILPDGELRLWAGSMAATLQPAYLVATLATNFYADPSSLWNAQPSASSAPTVSVVGNQLIIQAPADATGSYQIQVSASDGTLTSTQTFTLTIA